MSKQSIECVGVIMDGNRRWAREKGKPIFEGHRAGYDTLAQVVKWAREADVKNVIAYTFSTENWQRSEDEVGYLLKLFKFVVESEADRMVAEQVRVKFVGERERFSKDLQEGMNRIEAITEKSYKITLYLAVSYGGRAEILHATNTLLGEGAKSVTAEEFSKKLWTYPMPDPDLIIRTGGVMRLSGFLPWQAIYSELFFLGTMWPDFSETEFQNILKEYADREQRHGK
ncbi:MAG: polyprenyl diphosphate synthase [Patescibacteria group bacterium]